MYRRIHVIFLLVCLFALGLGAPRAAAQASLFKMFFFDMGKGLKLQSTYEKRKTTLQTRIGEIKTQIQNDSKGWTLLNQGLEREIQYYRRIALRYRSLLQKTKGAPLAPAILRLYLRLSRLADLNVELLVGIQTAYSSREQSKRKLRAILESALEAHTRLQDLLPKQYPPQRVLELRAHIQKLYGEQKEHEKQWVVVERTLKESEAVLEVAQKKFDRLRRLLLHSQGRSGGEPAAPFLPSSRPKKKNPPTSQPNSKEPSETPLETGALGAGLEGRLKLRLLVLSFHRARLKVRMGEILLEDEKTEHETIRNRRELITVMLTKMEAWFKRASRLAEGGMFFRKSMPWFPAVGPQQTKMRWSLKPLQSTLDLKEGLQRLKKVRLQNSAGRWWWLLALGLLLSLFIVVWLALFVKNLHGRISTLTFTAPWVRPLRLFLKILKLTLPWFYVIALLMLGLMMFGGFAKPPWMLMGWLFWLFVGRVVWVALSTLFANERSIRFFYELDDQSAVKYRRVLKILTLIWLAATPVLSLLHKEDGTSAFYDLFLCLMFFVSLCFWIYLSFQRSSWIELLSRKTLLGRVVILFIYHLYWFLCLVPVGLFVLYCLGYQNLAEYIFSGLFWTAMLAAGASWTLDVIDHFFEELQGVPFAEIQAPAPVAPLPAEDLDLIVVTDPLDPKHADEFLSKDLSVEYVPLEPHADSAVLLDEENTPDLVVVAEAQTAPGDDNPSTDESPALGAPEISQARQETAPEAPSTSVEKPEGPATERRSEAEGALSEIPAEPTQVEVSLAPVEVSPPAPDVVVATPVVVTPDVVVAAPVVVKASTSVEGEEGSWFRAVGLGRLFVMLTLWICVVGLFLEVWDVPGGFLSLWSALSIPLFQVQNTQITSWSVLRMMFTIGFTIWLSRLAPSFLESYFYTMLQTTAPVQYAVNTLVSYTLIFVGILVGLQWMGTGLGGLLLTLGIIALSLGFGLRGIANNFISGLIIIFGRPFVINDFITVGTFEGRVREITARSTLIETPNKRMILIPNAVLLSEKIVNWSMKYPYIRARVDVGVAYCTEFEKIHEILMQIAKENKGVLPTPAPKVRLRSLEQNHMQYGMNVTVSDPIARFRILSEIRMEIVKRFGEAGIEIALPKTRLHFSPEIEDSFAAALESSPRSLSEEAPLE